MAHCVAEYMRMTQQQHMQRRLQKDTWLTERFYLAVKRLTELLVYHGLHCSRLQWQQVPWEMRPWLLRPCLGR